MAPGASCQSCNRKGSVEPRMGRRAPSGVHKPVWNSLVMPPVEFVEEITAVPGVERQAWGLEQGAKCPTFESVQAVLGWEWPGLRSFLITIITSMRYTKCYKERER